MSIEQIRDDVHAEAITFGPHLVQRMYENGAMQCPNGCDVSMETVQVERIFYRDGEPVVISGLEMYVCPDCGCEAMPLKSARIVESVLNGRMEPVGRFSAPLFQLVT